VVFHVEIRRSMRHARAFNLDEERLRRTVLDRWRAGRTVELGDQEWDPGESELTILEGPALSQPDLALGQGWNNAERSSTNVTTRVLDEAAAQATVVAVLAETPEAHEAATRLLGHIGVREVDWLAVRARLLAAATTGPGLDTGIPGVVVMIVVDRATPSAAWVFDAGVAIGALGSRAILTRVGETPLPRELRDLGAMQLDPDEPASLHALAERVRVAGRAV
jgi:hypothetical protein